MSELAGYIQIATDELRSLMFSALLKAQVPAEEAEIIAVSLLEADMRGVYTHGSVCLKRYIDLMDSGKMLRSETHRVIKSSTVIEVWDGMRSSGQVLGSRAMNRAVEMAQEGIGIVAVRSSNHFGAGAYYAQIAQKQGMIGIAMSTGASTMAPYGGSERLIGNNPVAVSVPCPGKPAITLDMAQSVVAFGKITNLLKQGAQTVPDGWALDAKGIPTTDIGKVNTVRPMAEYKGFGAALIVDILSGILFGGATGNRAADAADGPSCLFMAVNPGFFGDVNVFYETLSSRIDELKRSKLASGSCGIFIPGEKSESSMRAARETVWMMPEILDDLRSLPR